MVDNDRITTALEELDELSKDEYGKGLDGLLADRSRSSDDRLWRLGRLIGITIKEQFAQPTDELPPTGSETGALRAWILPEPFEFDPAQLDSWQYEVLKGLTAERDLRKKVYLGPNPAVAASTILLRRKYADEGWNVEWLASEISNWLSVDPQAARRAAERVCARSETSAPTESELAEWLWEELEDQLQSPMHVAWALHEMHSERGLFRCVAISARKYLCNDEALRARIEESFDTVGRTKGSLSPQSLVGAGSVAAVTNALPWLDSTGSIVAVGLLMIIGNVGLDGFCSWVSERVALKRENPKMES